MSRHRFPYYFSFDVESIGIYGEGFAVGIVVADQYGTEVETHLFACPSDEANGFIGIKSNREWIEHNVLPTIKCVETVLVRNTREIMNCFMHVWSAWAARGAVMVTDVPFPVESNFIMASIRNNPYDWEQCPVYPLIDVASMLFAHGYDPTASFERLECELPRHNPLNDARQSLRIMFSLLKGEPVT